MAARKQKAKEPLALVDPLLAGDVTLYCGDAREVLMADNAQQLLGGVQTVLTDAPYAAWRYITETESSGTLSLAHDIRWQTATFKWVVEWWWPMRRLMQPDGVVWIFCNVHYLGFYARAATLSGLQFRGVFACAGENREYLCSFGNEAIAPEHGRSVVEALSRNTYGQDKSTEMLAAILRASREGLVLDPFCGGGSTLAAARSLGWRSVGVEIEPERAELAKVRLA